MNTRRRTRRPVGPEDQGEGPPRRYAKRKSGNEGLYIALGAAAVIGVVVVFVLMGSSGGEELALEGKAFLRQVFDAAIADRADLGAPLMDAKDILQTDSGNKVEKWQTMGPEERDALRDEAFRWVMLQITQSSGLNVATMAEADQILESAEAVTRPSENRVDIQWVWNGEKWNAKLRKRGGDWLLMGFARIG